jgi:hypothetical protein
MSRPGLAIVVALLVVFGVFFTQRLVTSPGVTTYGELRILVLVSIPALVAILSAYWVDAGHREREGRR